jgi:lipoprotein-releasing system ATP-binding protein
LNGLTFTASKSSLTAITGKSGSGKTTLLNLISGIDKPTGGEIIFNDKVINNSDSLTQFADFGFVFQFHYLISTLTIEENILIAAEIKNLPTKQARLRLHDFAAQLGINDKLKQYPFQLSGGERQRAAVIRAIINEPSLVLMDEPTGNLDQDNSIKLQELLMDLMHQQESVFIVATHDIAFAGRADQVIAL